MRVWIHLFRKMKPEKRVELALSHSKMLFGLVETNVRMRYPQADEREVFLRVAARHLSRDLMIRAYDWDPELHR